MLTKKVKIKCFRKMGNAIWADSEDGKRSLIAVAPSATNAGWLYTTLSRAHPFVPWKAWEEE